MILPSNKHFSLLGSVLACALALLLPAQAYAQQGATASGVTFAEDKLQALTQAVAQSQTQLELYKQQLAALQQQISDLRQQLALAKDIPRLASNAGTAVVGESSSSTLQDLSERESIVESQVSTHEVSKVETESKFPLKLSGLILLNGFVNTRGVDLAANPTYATPSSGSTGLSLRQTVLGLDASGPHLLGASSHADVRADFFGAPSAGGSYAAGGLLRLRTAHASLNWPNTKLFVALDRSVLAPNVASSLIAVSQPEFSWSGDLWTWNPQIGASQAVPLTPTSRLQLEAALIDVADPQLPYAVASSSGISLTERSRWPGTEARFSYAHGDSGTGLALGVGGYFSPHRTKDGVRFNAWAGTLDARIPLGTHFRLTANAYRGMALGGLGAGGYLDYFYQYRDLQEIVRPLDDVGGWTQLKFQLNERLEFNGGFGIDNPFAKEFRNFLPPPGVFSYAGLGRNRTTFGNVIYGPSSYLLFSLEYRHLWSNYATGPTYSSDVIGLGAGYRF